MYSSITWHLPDKEEPIQIETHVSAGIPTFTFTENFGDETEHYHDTHAMTVCVEGNIWHAINELNILDTDFVQPFEIKRCTTVITSPTTYYISGIPKICQIYHLYLPIALGLLISSEQVPKNWQYSIDSDFPYMGEELDSLEPAMSLLALSTISKDVLK